MSNLKGFKNVTSHVLMCIMSLSHKKNVLYFVHLCYILNSISEIITLLKEGEGREAKCY